MPWPIVKTYCHGPWARKGKIGCGWPHTRVDDECSCVAWGHSRGQLIPGAGCAPKHATQVAQKAKLRHRRGIGTFTGNGMRASKCRNLVRVKKLGPDFDQPSLALGHPRANLHWGWGARARTANRLPSLGNMRGQNESRLGWPTLEGKRTDVAWGSTEAMFFRVVVRGPAGGLFCCRN